MQTRRLIKKDPVIRVEGVYIEKGEWFWRSVSRSLYPDVPIGECPYGKPGDLLWVRETHYIYGHWKKKCDPFKRFYFVPNAWTSVRFCDDPPRPIETSKLGVGWYKRPSIHMLRKYSRILLEVTAVRIERLRKMSEQDCIEEGIKPISDHGVGPSDVYAELWDDLNGPGSWEANPWVWVIEFKTKEIKKEVKFNGASQVGQL